MTDTIFKQAYKQATYQQVWGMKSLKEQRVSKEDKGHNICFAAEISHQPPMINSLRAGSGETLLWLHLIKPCDRTMVNKQVMCLMVCQACQSGSHVPTWENIPATGPHLGTRPQVDKWQYGRHQGTWGKASVLRSTVTTRKMQGNWWRSLPKLWLTHIHQSTCLVSHWPL